MEEGLAVSDAIVAEPSSRGEADAWLRETSHRAVRAHLSTREDQDFSRSHKSMIDQAAREYGGRFLHELIQNGYDTNARDGDTGRIAVILAGDEGAHGTLYVANTGAGFTASNARRIRSLGLSDKAIGAGIGNKGVGFKSVLQICSTPEVYSTFSDGDPGFCFRFATETDVPELVGGNVVERDQVIDEISLYSITLPTESIPDRVQSLWDDGYATVVRLPLDEDAADQVLDRIAEVEASDVPLMLFLDRLAEVSVSREAAGEVERVTLTREARPNGGLSGDFGCDVVMLDGSDEYLVFSRAVDPDSYEATVAEAIKHHQLDKRYAEAGEHPVVSVAVPYGATDAQDGRTYTFLPLGRKAPSPFAGHLNAPFYADFARKDLDADHRLNRLLLEVAAGLCLDVAARLTGWRDDAAVGALLDLLGWDPDWLPLLANQARTNGLELVDRPLLPSRAPHTWLSIGDARRWPTPETAVLTAAQATSACSVQFLPDLPPSRTRRLDAVFDYLDCSLDPSPAELASWTEIILDGLASSSGDLTTWDNAYTDIATLFETAPDALRSRRILLTDDWTLRPCAAGRQPNEPPAGRDAPFFPPTSQRVDDDSDVDDDTDLSLPKSLSERMFFLNSGLTWHATRQPTRARRFLQDNRLVRGFEVRAILDHLRSVLRHRKGKRIAEDALRYVFDLVQSGAPIKTDLAELGLRVKTARGDWIPARECLFSSAWPGTNGDDLSVIAATAEDRSAELHALSQRLLAPPHELPRPGNGTAEWTRFLRLVGVRDALPLDSVVDDRHLWGSNLTRHHLAAVTGLPDPVRTLWTSHLPEAVLSSYPYTPYVTRSPVYWLPGQGDWAHLPDRVRHAMSRQIVRGLMTVWPRDALDMTWTRDRSGDKDPQTRPTPLRAFLRSTAWIPQQQPGQGGERFARPRDCWTIAIRSDDAPPRFAPLIARPFRVLLDDDANALAHLRSLGLGVWGTPADAPRLVGYLGELFYDGTILDAHAGAFHNAYRSAWAMTTACGESAQPLSATRRSYLVVDVGGTATSFPIEVEDAAPSAPGLVVAGREDEQSLRRLLADFGRNVLEVDSQPDVATAILRRRLGDLVVRATSIAPEVVVNGKVFDTEAAAAATPIVDVLPWLPLLVATLLEYHRTQFVRLGQRAFDEAVDAVRRVRVAFGADIEVRLGHDIRALPDRLHGVLPIPSREYPALIVDSAHRRLTSSIIEAIAEPLTYLIGRREYDRTVRWAFERMRRIAGDDTVADLTYSDIAEICDVTADDVRNIALRIQSSLAPLLYRLYPIVVHLAGAKAAEPFDPDAATVESESDVHDALSAIADRLGRDVDELLSAAQGASTLAGVQKALAIPVAEINATLTRAGERFPLIDYGEQHADDFADHVRRRRDELLGRMRWSRWDRFRAYEAQPDWPRLRRLDTMQADPEWGTSVDELNADQMDERIEQELAERLGTVAPVDGPDLRSLDECVKANAELIVGAVPRLHTLVRAWQAGTGRTGTEPWIDEESAGHAIRIALDTAGALDFAPLGIDDLIQWLRALGLWPVDMPPSMDLDVLDLESKDLDVEAARQQRQRAERAKAKRTVHIDDQPFDLDDGLAAFKAALDASLNKTPGFLQASHRIAALAEPTNRPGSSRSAGGGSGRRETSLSDRQKVAIGLAGEWFAYQWLEQRYGGAFTSECWVSGYREEVFAGTGDDGLGWDFEVPARRGSHLYEVKTTMTDGGQIELGETEVLAAQAQARNRRWRLLVITNVLNETRRLRLLPNPFDPTVRGRYAFVGQGLRLRYVLE